jgi:hypothetical protein
MRIKQLLLTGITALLLATGAAHARPWSAYYCGKHEIADIPAKYFLPDRENCAAPCDGKGHYFDMKKDPDQRHPLPDRLFRVGADGALFYKGKRCRDFPEEYYARPWRKSDTR